MSAPSRSGTHARCGYTGLQSSLIVPVQDTWLQTYAPCSSLPTSSLATSDTSSLIFALEIISQKRRGGPREFSQHTKKPSNTEETGRSSRRRWWWRWWFRRRRCVPPGFYMLLSVCGGVRTMSPRFCASISFCG